MRGIARAVTAGLCALAACNAEPRASLKDDAATDDLCEASGQTRCDGQAFQTCEAGTWQTTEVCESTSQCTALGCGQCDPAYDHVCVGSDLYTCHDDGTLGGRLTTCGTSGCSGHACNPPDADDCGEGTQLIYVIDKDQTLLSFDPRHEANTFHVIGQVHCPAGPPWPAVLGAGLGVATPLSMSVDRGGRAWVLYTSGEIFWVSTADAGCTPSSFVKGAGGFQLFGMGFVGLGASAAPAEELYVVGGPDDVFMQDTSGTRLGVIDPLSGEITAIAPVATQTYLPELSGSADGELWAYFPADDGPGEVARLDKVTGARLDGFGLPEEGKELTGWAFAHYAGMDYLFVTRGAVSQVLRLDPGGNGGAGQVLVMVPNSPYAVVGAGVSTCAPQDVE
jgi:hypothetical protein